MKMRSPIPKHHARIEIIPLIDIMFFLLASFMMVSLSQTHMKGIRVNLPSANTPPPPPTQVKDYVSLRVTEGGLIYMDNAPIMTDDLLNKLYQLHEQNKDVKVSLSAEMLATHGDVISVLDKIRLAGITKIGYQIKAASVQGATGTLPPPPAPPPPPK
jgi:biopolymer transport protein ExbD